MAPGDGTPLSLRPFPVADKKPQNIAEFISRVNAQPGGFRAISESKLRQDAARQSQDNGDHDDEDMDVSDADDEDEGTSADPNQARFEVLKNIDMAANTAVFTLDSLSLLLSKQNPTQAGLTLSKQLRELAGIGTLGADRLEEPNTTESKEKDQETVATGWTLAEVNEARDSAEAACTFLQKEVEAESRYWEDVVSVQKGGWSVCRLPQEKHTLGVRFGFTESAAEFKNSGLAPMRRGDDGSVQLDCGKLGSMSERLVITCERDGRVVGRSTVPAQTADDAPLEARVLEARNTLFAQELWHELSREARALAAFDVRSQASSLTYDVDDKIRITAELLPLGSDLPLHETLQENDAPEAVSLALHLLLGYAHRHNELMRIRPLPPHIPRSRGQNAYALLRPIIARIMFMRSTWSCTRYVGGLVQTLQKAGLGASFTLQTSQLSIPDSASQGPNQLSSSQLLVRSMLQPPDFNITLNLLPETCLTIRGRTYLFPVTATYYHVFLPPSSPLATVCPPYKDGYPDLYALAYYLRAATAHLLTEHYLCKLSKQSSGDWAKTIQEVSIRNAKLDNWELFFSVMDKDTKDSASPTLSVKNFVSENGKIVVKTWTWGSSEDHESLSMDEVVTQVADAVSL